MTAWTLDALGWRSDLEVERERAATGLTVGRVAIEYGGLYRVLLPSSSTTELEELTASLPGKWRLAMPLDVPAVGDWVGLRASGDGWSIEYRFERRTQFVRQASGRRTQPQVVGANVDIVFIVTALDDDFSPRRVERYMTAILDGGAQPVVVLSKADLCHDLNATVDRLQEISVTAPVIPVSALRSEGIDRLGEHLASGRTAAFTGSSGVGKSTLVNTLVGRDVQRTQSVRLSDSKGRHTTTHRELIPLAPDRGLLIDTPGMRELQLWTSQDSVERAFDDVRALAESCRFNDCRHDGEPGCGVDAAVARGELSADRKASYLKLVREQAEHQAKANLAELRVAKRRFRPSPKKLGPKHRV